MNFQYDGKHYEITFKREFKPFRNPLFDGDPFNNAEWIPCKYPYTTAIIDVCQHDPMQDGKLVVAAGRWREATVGCWHREQKKFNSDRGRTHALRCITKTIPKEMIPLMWAAYTGRFAANKPKVKK